MVQVVSNWNWDASPQISALISSLKLKSYNIMHIPKISVNGVRNASVSLYFPRSEQILHWDSDFLLLGQHWPRLQPVDQRLLRNNMTRRLHKQMQAMPEKCVTGISSLEWITVGVGGYSRCHFLFEFISIMTLLKYWQLQISRRTEPCLIGTKIFSLSKIQKVCKLFLNLHQIEKHKHF